ncbi:MAG: DUF4160 domain-containing protein [Candidatus Sumerlaeota bacterium]|nr:DUF4160 domain-containing protein [Candidatus Sumerlaeota bacterium]
MRMFHEEHNPSHMHADYSGKMAVFYFKECVQRESMFYQASL